MRVLLIGSGGREHALAWKLSQSPKLSALICAPGNPGTADIATNATIDLDDHDAVIDFCRLQSIDLVVIGPEAPLVAGLADDLRAADIAVFGPSAQAARLEGSKGFTKDLCARYGIPTAAYQRFNNAPKARAYARAQGAPIVIKADGLAAGKGVTVAMTMSEALDAIDDCFQGAFGDAGADVVVEEYLAGEEVSFFCLADGRTALPLASAQDHKRVGEGDTGPNTGGMGAYSPAPVFTGKLQAQVMSEIILPTLDGMAEMGCPFSGVLYAGLMLTARGPKLIEYNVRFGDPECQVLMARLNGDLLEMLWATAKGALDQVRADWREEAALVVVLCAPGYPAAPEKGSVIENAAAADALDGVHVFHAGTKLDDGMLVADGGRVLNIVGLGASVTEAQRRAHQGLSVVNWPEGFSRSDIGWRAIARENASD